MKHQHILVIRFSALGDVAMTVPVVWALARQYPDVRVTVLSRPMMRPIFEGLAPNINFMGADIKGEYHGIKGLNRLYRRLVAKQPTHVADLHSVLRSEYLRLRFNMGHFKVKHIDKHRSMRRKLVAPPKEKRMVQLPSSFNNYLEVFEKLGFPVDTRQYHFHSIFPAEGGDLSLLPAEIGQKGSDEKWIGIAPFAAHQGKIYPVEKTEQVVKMLLERYPKARLFLFGRGRQEDQYFAEWTERYPQCTFVGRHLDDMRQELILMSHLDVMMSMDSANQHLASLTATPVVSIWGATHPMAGFMAWDQPDDRAIQINGLDCRPCSIFGNKPCRYGDYRCLAAIEPAAVASKIASILES